MHLYKTRLLFSKIITWPDVWNSKHIGIPEGDLVTSQVNSEPSHHISSFFFPEVLPSKHTIHANQRLQQSFPI